ncbi:MAG: hypothetical protein J6T57_00030 [Alphaproteobacteria bacterium]|nr:hypothetical protein [Alphaproteobacteria bacterium]
MKKIFLSIITCIFTICNVYASLTPEQDKLKIEYEKAKKEQIANLVETIKNAPSGSITSTNIPTFDDCTHTIVNKDNVQIFYEQVCFPIDLRFKGFDPVKNASYIFTIYNGTTKNTIAGDYKDFQELLSLIPSPTPPTSKQKETFGESCDKYKFDVVWKDGESISVAYNYGQEDKFVSFQRIFNDPNKETSVYLGDNNEIFMHKDGEWKNYGHHCTTKKEYNSVVQNCGQNDKIKIVWYKEKRDPYILADLKADADPWGFSDVILVYKMKCDDGTCKPPLVLLREGQGTSFKNADMTIKYGEYDSNVKWKIDSKLCKNIPDCLESEAESWAKSGFTIEYAGKYPEEFDGYTNVDIYQTIAPTGSRTGFPTVYAIHDNTIIKKISGLSALEILNKVNKSIISF